MGVRWCNSVDNLADYTNVHSSPYRRLVPAAVLCQSVSVPFSDASCRSAAAAASAPAAARCPAWEIRGGFRV